MVLCFYLSFIINIIIIIINIIFIKSCQYATYTQIKNSLYTTRACERNGKRSGAGRKSDGTERSVERA